jgi:CTP synthase
MAQPKFIFICGGVMSGVGKGITTSSIGTILQSKGFSVTLVKADPYLNVDAGTMNPTEHGEVFVLDSGLETDQDMGNYERFLGKSIGSDNYMTTGMVFKHVIDRERALEYEGKCVEFFYHIPMEIVRRVKKAQERASADITIIEIGGTLGEYQNALYIEAARRMHMDAPEDVKFVMVSYLPTPGALGEMKTKPTQNALQKLRSFGVSPDMIIARAEHPVDQKRKEKIALFAGINADRVISAPDIDSIYQVPVNFEDDGMSDQLLTVLDLPVGEKDLVPWRAMVKKMREATKIVKIGVVGKYFGTGDFSLSDAYISVLEAIKSASAHLDLRPEIVGIDSRLFEGENSDLSQLDQYDGILVPGGFGQSGIEGKIKVIQYVREKKIPYFGLCYGMQLMVIEYARNIAGLVDANTAEIDPDAEHLVIDILPEQKKLMEESNYGGTMRLGTYPAHLEPGTLAAEAYGTNSIDERHRHRFEVNPEYVQQIKDAGLVFSGTSPDGVLMEIAELPKSEHPFMLGTQFHPEFLARPLEPHPLFIAFLEAASGKNT